MSGRCNACLDAQFDKRRAESQVSDFRRSGAPRESRLLIDLLVAEGVQDADLLDIGAGIGVLHDALLVAGARRVTSVDASGSYLDAAEKLATERGYRDRVEYHLGDFVDLAESLRRADVVTLDKVICCYDDMRGLVTESADMAGRLLGAVYPRDNPAGRFVTRLQNGMRRIRGNAFRTYVHSERAIEAVLAERGLVRRSSASTLAWRIAVFARG